MDILNTKIKSILTEKNTKILPNNIKSGVNILGVAGNVIALNGETKTITPTTSQQTITPSQGKNGITEATIEAVTSSIDANITAGNIKKDVTILGVTGTYEGQQPSGTISITQNGTVDVSEYASADVSVSGSGGKNTQAQLGMFVKTKTAYAKSGLSITVAKTGTYTIKWLCQRMSTSGTSGSALIINNVQYGSNYETWGLTYYKDNVQNATQAAEYVLNEVNNVSLNENDVVEIYGRSNSNGTWEYNYALVIEEE